ncbi:hypothetical protein CTAYLR_004095 [Chrysophaeum taylorii]|uniref:Glycosyl transferase CAP10 domain-containing protein n=1 Tax=Chrysophaeum taylorii TaxID=2483200 RepID=A0AAD7UCW9_9STRA|nr:hypothetical protein CTAYLR_004095 [Chrysophaeum taylorii]
MTKRREWFALAVVVGACEFECDRLERWTNGFQRLATEDPISIDEKTPPLVGGIIYTANGHLLEEMQKQNRIKSNQFPSHLIDDLKALDLMDVRFRFELGDAKRNNNFTTLSKTRLVDDPWGVLYPMNLRRHYPPEIFEHLSLYDMPFALKEPTLVWRGATTGQSLPGEMTPRKQFVFGHFNFSDRIDVGFSSIEQGHHDAIPYMKKEVPWKDHLRFKYIMSLEGNDIASGLKWQLLSNSVVFMPKPTVDSWFLESTLIPYVHYVPVNANFSNLLDQLDWADAHPYECETIAKVSTEYAIQAYRTTILDPAPRRRVLKLVLGGGRLEKFY